MRSSLVYHLEIALLLTLAMSPAIEIASAQTAIIGGDIYTGANDGTGPIMAPAATPLNGVQVMVQNQRAGGAFITYGTVSGNAWTADVPAPGDYVVMFSVPDHDCTSREFTLTTEGEIQLKDAYLPPLPLPTANLLVYTFYENEINGEDDDGEDAHLNGVTVSVWDDRGNLLATGVTGTQSSAELPQGGEQKGRTDGLYYFTGLPPGEVRVTSDPSTAYLYDVNGTTPLPVVNPLTRSPLDFDETTEFYLLSSEEGGRAFEAVLYPGDPGTEAGAYLVWHGFAEKLGQITEANVKQRFGPRGSLLYAGSITGIMADADRGWIPEPLEPGEAPEALIPPLHPGVTANTIVANGLVVLHVDSETMMPHAVATAEADPITGEFRFDQVPPGRYKLFCSDIPIDYVYIQQQVSVAPHQDVVFPDPSWGVLAPSIMVPRFFARAQGFVKDNTTGAGIPGAKVNIRLKDGSVWMSRITDATGWYRFDNLPEVEVLAHVDVTLPAGYRGAIVTDTFYPGAYWINPNCNPIQFPQCVELGQPYEVTHNAMNRYIQWYTANYNADLLLEPIPPASGDIGGIVYYDHLATGTWVGNGIYDEEDDRSLHGVTVELWDATGTTLLATTTTGAFNKAATLAQGWHEPYTMPVDEWGGVYVGPMPGFYEFRDLAPGDYLVKVIPQAGFSPSPVASDVIAVTVSGGARKDSNFGMNTIVPLSGKVEGGVFDDLFVDPRPFSLMFLEKAGIDKAPVGIYDHLGYFLGSGFQGNPMCYHSASVGTNANTQCPIGESLGQKPEIERRVAPTALLYLGNDPSLPGFNEEYLPLIMPYTMGQGKHKFEADWSLIPVAFGQGPTHEPNPPLPPPAMALPTPPPAPVIQEVTNVGGYILMGTDFGAQRGFSTVTLSGRELYVTSWTDTEIHVGDPIDPISGPMIVTTHAGSSNAMPVEITYDSNRAQYMAERSVFVDTCNTGAEDGSQAAPWCTLEKAMAHLPTATPRYIFVAAGYYNERIQITESDIQFIGAGPRETILDGLGSMQLSMESQGFVGRGPVFFIGQGGEFGGVSNILISGLTITRGSVDDDIGCGIFGDAGNRNIDINTCIIDHNGGYYGGGIWLQKTNHDVRIWSNTISNNGCAGGYGGGISVNDEPEYGPHHGEPEHVIDDEIPGCPPGTYEIFNNHLVQNFSPDYGGAISLYEVKDQLIVAGNLIEENHADDHGGAVFFEESGPIELYGNIILRNSNYDDGGAVSFEDITDQNAVVRVHHNVIARNWADDHGENHVRGGAIAFDDTFYAEIFNNTIVENVAAGSRDPVGGAIDSERHGHEYDGSESLGRDFAPGFSDVMIYGNIIRGNMRLKYDQKHHSDEEDLDWTFGINHVWSPDNFHVDDPAVQLESESHLNTDAYSLVEFNCIDNGEYSDRLGNVDLDPMFIDPQNDDWRLQPGSPVLDMGATAGGGGLPDVVGTVSPLAAPEPMCNTDCFAINEVTIDTVGNNLTAIGTSSSLLSFDPAIDGVGFSVVDGSGYTVDCWIPPGSFVVDGIPGMGMYIFTGPVLGMNMQVQAQLSGCTFTISTTRAPRISRPIGTKMMISLSVGNTLGREGILLAESTGQLTYVRTTPSECCPIQPILFDHAEHMEKNEANLSCLDCHAGAATQDYAGLPGKAVCFNCHTAGGGGNGGPDGNGGEDDSHDGHKSGKFNDKKKIHDHEDDSDDDNGGGNGGGGLHQLDELLPYMNNDVELPWTPMATLRQGVLFSHSRHVTIGQVDCMICHADQAFLNRPREVVYRVMTMRQCRVCHQDNAARIDCAACHEYSFGPNYIAGE